MKFEYNNKSGLMEPVKNKQIYFSRSMSGGLRVDDQIHNVKYVIERDGKITYISGIKKINIYDYRNAHIIADRVKRMFGPDNKFTDYKLFTEGYYGIMSYDNFVNERLFKSSMNRVKSGDIRKEDGIKIKIPDIEQGYVILDDKGCGLPYKINEDVATPDEEYYIKIIYHNEGDIYVFGYEDDGSYTYFMYDENNEEEGYLTQLATSDYNMADDEFKYLIAMCDSPFVNEDMEFHTYGGSKVSCEIGKKEYLFYNSENDAEDAAIENQRQIIEDTNIDSESLKRWLDFFGDEFIDTSSIEDMMRESEESYVGDIENENGIHGTRLFDELIENDIIEDSDEYFETDEDGELDYDQPLFDIDDKKEEFVDYLCDRYDDVLEWYSGIYGTYEGLEKYVDIDKLAELIVDNDGICYSLDCENDFEYNGDGFDILIFEKKK